MYLIKMHIKHNIVGSMWIWYKQWNVINCTLLIGNKLYNKIMKKQNILLL